MVEQEKVERGWPKIPMIRKRGSSVVNPFGGAEAPSDRYEVETYVPQAALNEALRELAEERAAVDDLQGLVNRQRELRLEAERERDQAEAALARLYAKLTQATEALRHYGRHTFGYRCHELNRCSCGLERKLQQLEAVLARPTPTDPTSTQERATNKRGTCQPPKADSK